MKYLGRFFGLLIPLLVLYAGLLAQSGPGGVSTPTNNTFWLRSDKGVTFDGSNNVTTWTDQANSNNATNAATATNPMYDNTASIGTNGEPAILFAASSSEFLDIADDNAINTTSVTARTVYIIFQTGADITTQQYLYEQGGTTNGLFFYIQGGQLSAGINSSSSNFTISSAAASIVTSTAYIVVLTYDGTAQTIDLQLDGTASTTVGSVAASVATHTTIKVGSDGTSGNFYTGHIAEIIYYDVVLNDGEIRMVNNYLSEKYGITTANDHYSTPGATYRYELTGISRVNAQEHNASNGLGGTLYLSENPADQLSDDEHVMAGHNNDNQSNTATDMSLISGSDRYNRIWYFEKTGTLGLRVEYDIVEAGLAVPTDANDYQLIRRAGTSGDFAEVTATKSLNGNRVRFDVSDANFTAGYFSLGYPATDKNWYVINSGTWDDPNTWTLDPAGIIFNNPENLTPSTSPSSATDEVTIGSGKTVTLDNDGDIPNPLTKLTIEGTLDFVSTSGHGTITELVGSGTIRSSGDDVSTPRLVNFPTITDASNFVSAGTGAGTIEFYGSEDIEISATATISTFYNLVTNLTTAADDELIITTDITINGDLTVTSGNFQINDATAAVQRTITVNGALNVGASGEMSVGTGNPGTPATNDAHNTYHQLLLQGDFTNNGICSFSNISSPNYTTYTTTGAVTVRFQGSSDNNVTIANVTEFYNLVIEKGSDQTYILDVTSSNENYFRIFGRNTGTSAGSLATTTDGNPATTSKALWLRSGTLKLTGNLNIPSLSEGASGNESSWFIPANAKLWLNGPNVQINADAPGDGAAADAAVDVIYGITGTSGSSGGISVAQTLFLFGTLKISDGTFDHDDTGILVYDDERSPILEIEGGNLIMSAVRQRTLGAGSSSPFSWIQSGGIVDILGDAEGDGVFVFEDYALLNLASTETIFQMSEGTINIKGVKKYRPDNPALTGGQNNTINPNGIWVQSSAENYSVTGGTINIEMDNTLSQQLDGSDVDNDAFPASFTIDFTPNFYNLNIIDDDAGTISFVSGQNVVVSGDLSVSNTTTMELNNNNINIGRNFNVIAGGTYTQGGNNATTFDGNSAQAISLAGTLTTDFYDVSFSGTDTKTLFSGDLTATNSLTIASGATINDGGRTIFIENTITNSGAHESDTGGEIEFSGGSAAYTVSGDDNGVFGNVTLNDATNDVNLTADQAITGILTFSQDQLLDIDINSLTMQGASASISGATSARYIQMAGNASDDGLSMYVDANETITYPIGTDASATARYTPVSAIFSNYPTADDGYVTISIGEGELQTLNLTGGSNILNYYWRVNHNNFATPPRVTYDFVYDNFDIGGNENTYVAGKVLDENPFTRSEDDVTGGDTSVDTGTNTITFNNDNGTPFDVENANYTAGSNAKFTGTLTTYYSRWHVNETTIGPDLELLWNNSSAWSLTGHDGVAALAVPGAGDIAVIGFGQVPDGANPDDNDTGLTGTGPHRMLINGAVGNITVAEISYDSNTGAQTIDETISRIRMGATQTLTVGKIDGLGELNLLCTTGGCATVTADLGDFNEIDDSTIAYATIGIATEGAPVTITDTEFPTLRILGQNNNQYLTFSNNITAKNLFVDRMTNLLMGGDIIVSGDAQIGSSDGEGEIVFPNDGNTYTLEVSNLSMLTDVDNEIRLSTTGASVANHTLIVNGNIDIQTANAFDLSGTSNIILQLGTAGDHTFSNTSGTTPDLYQINMNKGTSQSNTFSFDDDFTISTPAVGLPPIVLQNGTLILNDANIGAADDVVLTNATNNTSFDIPSTAGLQISAGKAVITGTDIGITLDGLLQIDGTGELDMDGGDNNFIEYSGSGSATLTVGGTGILSVGSQIRRGTSLESGIFSYAQSGSSTVTVGNGTATSPATNRPMFDVRNIGSSFTFSGGTLVLVQDFSTAATPSLYLDPDGTPTVSSGALIQFGNANTPTNGNEDMTIYSTVTLDALEINTTNGPTLTLSTIGLSLSDDLLIETGTNLNANGLGLTVGGDFNNTDGATGFTANSNTTTLNGSSTQIITGNGTTFYNLTKNAPNTLQLAGGTDITVSNNLSITAGILDDNDNDISVSGILNNTATHTNNSGSGTNNGIILAGSNAQAITGAGTFSRIRINNTSGASTSANINITEQVILNGGVLDIQGNELAMDDDAIFVDGTGAGFSSTNMVETRRSFTDAGVVKTYNGIAASPFTYPIGSGTKFTPVVVTLTQNSQSTATIAVRAADEPHPNVQEDVDVPEFVDQNNVLQYYWEVTSTGMTDFIGDLVFTYEGTDAYVTSPFTLDDYHTARLLPDNSNNWNKLSTGFNYQAADGENTITFNLGSAVSDDEIGGDYTAGIEDAVPDQVQTVTSIVNPSGNWTTTGSWDTGAVPTGAIVVIDVGDQITLDIDGQISYQTVINGELIVGTTVNQRLGAVSGTGTLRINSGSLPAGTYDDFFNCSTGGSVDFGGAGSYTLPNQIASIRNLEISDGGTKSLPNVDVIICGDLILDDGATLENPQNRSVTIQGDLILTNGILNMGSNASFTVQGNATITAGTLNLNNNALTINGSLSLNGGTINLGTGGTLDVDTDVTIAGGTLNGANSASFNIGDDLTLTSGTFSVDGTTTTFTFDGTTAQVITGDFTNTSAFSNLTVNKASNGLTIIDAGNNDVEVDGTLTLTSGNIDTDAANTLTITSTGSVSGGSSASFVNGPLTRASLGAGEDFTFQIGKGSEYALAGVENVVTGGQNWSAEFFGTNPNNGQTIDIITNPAYGAMTGTTVNGSWTITSSGTNTASVVLGIQTHIDVDDLADIRVAIYDGPTTNEWVNLGGTSSGTASNGTITSQTTAGFSTMEFSLGGIGASSLPVELVSFSARVENDAVRLHWVTSSELNNDYFDIERSSDGSFFSAIGRMGGNGTTNNSISYDFADPSPLFGKSFYRLRQVDFDGDFEILPIVSVLYQVISDQIELTIYPNPVPPNSSIIFEIKSASNEPANISLFDINGHLHYRESIEFFNSNEARRISIDNRLNKGIYILKIVQGASVGTQKLIVH